MNENVDYILKKEREEKIKDLKMGLICEQIDNVLEFIRKRKGICEKCIENIIEEIKYLIKYIFNEEVTVKKEDGKYIFYVMGEKIIGISIKKKTNQESNDRVANAILKALKEEFGPDVKTYDEFRKEFEGNIKEND